MRAVTCTHGELEVSDVPDPVPARGQVVLAVRRCGICGSDLHAAADPDGLADVLVDLGYDDFMRTTTPVVLGHEFVGEVVERGRGVSRQLAVGTTVVSFPLVRAAGAVHLTGLSPKAPGGFAEQVLAEAAMSFVVPHGLDLDTAALTEPMAVAAHAVNRGEVVKRDTAIVLGCGPVGLAVICQLKARGVRTIVASDPSSARRVLATRCGADVVVDPTVESPYDVRDRGHLRDVPALFELAVGTMEKLRRVPGWSHVYRGVEAVGGADVKRPVVFECVGAPGMIDGVLAGAPLSSRVVVVGLCMGADSFRPSFGVNKEIDLRFALGYTPLELRDTLHDLAEGRIDASALVTGTVGLAGVAGAFASLRTDSEHAKVLVDPASNATI